MAILLLCLAALLLFFDVAIYVKTKKNPGWFILILPGIISVFIIVMSLFSWVTPLDTRLLEYSAYGIRHYPIWEEEIIPKNDTMEEYPVEHHAFYCLSWKPDSAIDQVEEVEIPKRTYEYYKQLWRKDGAKREEVMTPDSTREYGRYRWPKDPSTALIYTKTEAYPNYFKNVLNLYSISQVNKKEIKDYGLYRRASLTTFNSQNILEPSQILIYGYPNIPDSMQRYASFISTIDPHFRPILLVWTTPFVEKKKLVSKQRSYWDGGKDNEVVFCVAIRDTISKKILWSDSFSWATNKDLEEYVLTSSLHPGDSLELGSYLKSLHEGYQGGLWAPRDFSNYSIAALPSQYFGYLFIALFLLIFDVILTINVVTHHVQTYKYDILAKKRKNKNLD